MYSGTRNIAEQLKLEGPVACVDGCHIVHVGTRQDLFVADITGAAGLRLREVLSNLNLACFAFAADTIVFDRFGRRYVEYLRTWSERMLEVDSVTGATGWQALVQVNAVIALGSQADIETAAAALRQGDTPLQVVSFPMRPNGKTHVWVLIVRRCGIDKGTATRFLAEFHNVPLDRVVAVGDWINDVPMFQVAGHSFAMGQAPDHVKDTARTVLTAQTVTGGGIREAAERAGLL
jgi:hydroxymethylpyrimidine pyrophosphatase-like HAD family hydrolase